MHRSEYRRTQHHSHWEVVIAPHTTRRDIALSDTTLSVHQAGQGDRTILFVHSFPQDGTSWTDTMNLLAPDFWVVAPDMRGFGGSEKPRVGYGTRDRATDIIRLLDALNIERVCAVGHEWGAWALFDAVSRYPDRFDKLLALNIIHPWTYHRHILPNAWRLWYTTLFEVPFVGRTLVRRIPMVVDRLVRSTAINLTDTGIARYEDKGEARAAARAAEALHTRFIVSDIPRLLANRARKMPLHTPVRILGGSKDPIYPPAMLHVPPSRQALLSVRVIPDTGHWLHLESPQVVADEARAFFHPATAISNT